MNVLAMTLPPGMLLGSSTPWFDVSHVDMVMAGVDELEVRGRSVLANWQVVDLVHHKECVNSQRIEPTGED